MLKGVRCFVLCFVLHSVTAGPTPNVKLPPPSKWPSLIGSKSGRPVVPRLEDLKSAFMDRNVKPKKVADFIRLKGKGEENKDESDCKNNVQELEADVLLSVENNTTEVNGTERKKDKSIKKEAENEKKNQPIPNFIPIFRKRKPKRVKTPLPPEPEIINSTTTVQSAEVNVVDSVVKNAKKEHNVPFFNVSEALKNGKLRLTPFYAARGSIDTKHAKSATLQYPHEAPKTEPLKEVSPNSNNIETNRDDFGTSAAGIDVPSNDVFINNAPRPRIDTKTTQEDALKANAFSENDVAKSTTSNLIPFSNMPVITVPENAVHGTVPVNNVPANTDKHKIIPENIIFYAAPKSTASKNNNVLMVNGVTSTHAVPEIRSVLSNAVQEIVAPLNKILANIAPTNAVNLKTSVPTAVDVNTNHINVIPSNMLPINIVTRSAIPKKEQNKVVYIKKVPENNIVTKTVPKETVIVLKDANSAPLAKVPASTIGQAPKKNLPLNEAPLHGIFSIPLSNLDLNNIQSIPLESVKVKQNKLPENGIFAMPLNYLKLSNSPSTNPSDMIKVDALALKDLPNDFLSIPFDKLPPILEIKNIPNKSPADTLNIHENAIFSVYVNPSNTVQTNFDLSNIPGSVPDSTTVKAGTKDKSSGCKKADLVLFKPEDVSVLDVQGDILKKVTMTVLVPMYISKLHL